MDIIPDNTINIKTPAKINLTLDVTGKRDDGYHNLKMVMQTIGLYDGLTVSAVSGNRKEPVMLKVDKQLPGNITPRENLVYKAASLMREKYNIKTGFDITLRKNIPAAAGLAGGSSDCAATLIAINRLCRLNLTDGELCRTGATLGADVPYCIIKGTVLSEGIGDILTPLTQLPLTWVVLIKPPVSVSTAYVYSHLKSGNIKIRPDTDKMVSAIKNNNIPCIASCLCNVLETVTIPLYPVIQELKTFLAENGASGSLMSGSGPTIFGLFEAEDTAIRAYNIAKDKYKGYETIICHTCQE